MSILDRRPTAEIDRGPLASDLIAIAFIPMGISRIGPAAVAPETADFGALLGLVIVGITLIGALVYSLRTRAGPDEWVSRNWERACAVGILAVLIADMLWSLAAQAHLLRPMSADDLLGAQLIALSVAWLWFRWRG